MAEVEESEPAVKEDQGNFHFCWFNLVLFQPVGTH